MSKQKSSFEGIEITTNDQNTSVEILTTDADPNVSGLEAPIGSLALSSSGFTYQKIGALNTEWTPGNPLGATDNRLGWIQLSESVPETRIANTNSPIVLGFSNPPSVLNVINAPNSNTWWDQSNSKFQPDTYGDFYLIRLSFDITPSSNNRIFSVKLDIGGTQGVIWENTQPFPRNSGQAQTVNFAIPVYTLTTFIQNGGEFILDSSAYCTVQNLVILLNKITAV